MSETMKVYVAGSSDEMARARDVIKMLRLAGITVTSTWPEVTAAQSGGVANPRDAPRSRRRMWSTTDLVEVDAADALLFLAPEKSPGRGGYCEYGYAQARGKITAASGDTKQSVFLALGSEHDTDEAAIRWLVELSRDSSLWRRPAP